MAKMKVIDNTQTEEERYRYQCGIKFGVEFGNSRGQT